METEDKVIEYGVLFSDKKIFGDDKKHEYTVYCYDGYAVAYPVDSNDPHELYIQYIDIEDIWDDAELIQNIKDCRGLVYDEDITYGDIMMYCGVFVDKKPEGLKD